MTTVCLIPARMGSSRYPGKPLTPILGIPMIEHVYRRAAASPLLSEVAVATCDEAIVRAVEAFGGRAVMTADTHERASERVAEAAAHYPSADVVLMLQGDEPMVNPEMIEQSLSGFADPEVVCTNLGAEIRDPEEFASPNVIKLITDRAGNALYFSREPIPTARVLPFPQVHARKQVCVIGFRREFLLRYAALEPTPAEQAESVDMMRILEHGYTVRIIPTKHATHAVDIPADVEIVERALRADPLTATYIPALAGKG